MGSNQLDDVVKNFKSNIIFDKEMQTSLRICSSIIINSIEKHKNPEN